MRTLIINGSPKENGDTAALIKAFTANLKGDYRIVSMKDNISPCTDCRYCWHSAGCAIKDDMQEVYRYLEKCDGVVLASPVWFSSLSGVALNISSRAQTLYMDRRMKRESKVKPKNGVILLVGAEKDTEKAAAASARTILRNMGAHRPLFAEIYSMDTDNVPAKSDVNAQNAAKSAAEGLYAQYMAKL